MEKILLEVAGVDSDIITNALSSEIQDFEDAVQTETAKQRDVEIIITRDKNDFKNAGMQIYSSD